MTLLLDITDENGRTILHEKYADYSQFYVGTIGTDGKYSSLGGAKPKGKEFIKSIRQSAREWVREQDLNGFFQELREVLIQESIKAGNVQGQLCLQSDQFQFNADDLRSSFVDVKKEVANSFKQTWGKEGGYVFFHIIWEAMLAMIARLKEETTQIVTIWECSSSAMGKNEIESILEWLFRRNGP